ncbi:MAG: (d)CMP kinase [Bacteroidota bacterium]
MSPETKKITIAIDGFSSCGKSTLAKALARELGYIFIDSGAMYRAITLFCYRNKLVGPDFMEAGKISASLDEIELHFEFNPVSSKLEIILNGENVEKEIRTLQISQLVSQVSSIREVRKKLVSEQRKIGRKGGVVMDGRDIGSVVFPHAELKLFITADPRVRAERRFQELNDPSLTIEDVLENLQQRDHLDSTRKESPLVQTDDAIVIDNSFLTPDEQLRKALELVNNLVPAEK